MRTEATTRPEVSAAPRCARIVALLRLIHPFPAALVVVTSALLLVVAARGLPPPGLAGRMIAVVALSQVAIGNLNEWMDRHDDALVQPYKPIPSGLVHPSLALWTAVASLVGLILLAGSLGFPSLLLACLGAAAGIAYDLGLKRTAASFLCYAVAFLALASWIWITLGRWTAALLVCYPIGLCIFTAANLANTLPDIDGDRLIDSHGLAATLGRRRSAWSIVALTGAGVVGAEAVALMRGPVAAQFALLPAVVLAVSLPFVLFRGGRAWDRHVFLLTAPAVALIGIGTLLAASA